MRKWYRMRDIKRENKCSTKCDEIKDNKKFTSKLTSIKKNETIKFIKKERKFNSKRIELILTYFTLKKEEDIFQYSFSRISFAFIVDF